MLILSATSIGIAMTAIAGQPMTDKESVQLLADGNNFIAHSQHVEALWAYRQAAKAGNIEGAFAAGKMLLNESIRSRGRESILKSNEGLQFLFHAATNHHSQACLELSESLKNGIGGQANLVAAYAWLNYAVQFDHALKPNLDRLVVLLEPGEVREAQLLAHEFQLGHWTISGLEPIIQGDPRFMVQGITISPRGPLVVINNATLATGDTVDVRPANMLKRVTAERLTITCREVGADYALLSVAGENELRLLLTAEVSSF